MKKLYLLFFSYLVYLFSLFLYSFTQVDLDLTLSRSSIFQFLEKKFQYVGYFQRPESAMIFSILMVLAFVFYLIFFYLGWKKKLTKKQIWFLILGTFVFLILSYNAFSYDIFNYMFDAKIITHYGQNPYTTPALAFPHDPMINFMRWVHRVYPYGPFWLVLTVPLSYIGLNYFLPTFFLFKIMIGLSLLGTAYFISKILKEVSPENENLGLIFFALNPLVYIETFVSAHNDMPMLFFCVLALYLFIKRSYINSAAAYLFSVGIKFATGLLAPVILYLGYLKYSKKKINWEHIFIFSSLFMVVAVFLATFRFVYQPWYFLYVLPFAALTPKKYYIYIPVFVISILSLFQYLPFIAWGNWDPPVQTILVSTQLASVAISALLVLIVFLFKKFA